MDKKTKFFLLTMLIVAVTYSYFNIPNKFETEGGSCYQGITAMFIRFFLTVCLILNLLSIFLITYKSKIKTAKVLSILSLIIWLIGAIMHSHDNFLIGLTYFTPFLILNFIIVIVIFKNPKNKTTDLKL